MVQSVSTCWFTILLGSNQSCSYKMTTPDPHRPTEFQYFLSPWNFHSNPSRQTKSPWGQRCSVKLRCRYTRWACPAKMSQQISKASGNSKEEKRPKTNKLLKSLAAFGNFQTPSSLWACLSSTTLNAKTSAIGHGVKHSFRVFFVAFFLFIQTESTSPREMEPSCRTWRTTHPDLRFYDSTEQPRQKQRYHGISRP